MRPPLKNRFFHFTDKNWFFVLPILLFLLEILIQRQQPFLYYHYTVAFREQPAVATIYFLAVALRVILAITCATCLFELLCIFFPRSIRLRLAIPGVRTLSFLLLYAFGLRWVFELKPGVSGFFSFYYPKLLFVFAGAALLMLLWKKRRHSTGPLEPTPVAALGLIIAAIGLFATVKKPPVPTAHTAMPPIRPSFLIVGLDGIPADFFKDFKDGKTYVPQWSKSWAPRALTFENAYSVSNSTYTSWFSIFSGRYPFRSGVEMLYPTKREGNVPPDQLLPALLKAKGYRTVFMTDCGATSYFPESFGFDTRYQLGPGILGCGQSLLTSQHPFTYFYNLLERADFFPELNNFCSALYQPERFFNEVKSTLHKLDADGKPYFLAVHSCLTHQLLAHVPSMDSPLRSDLPEPSPSADKQRNLGLSLRLADYYLNDVLRKTEELRSTPWRILLSDHGVRIDVQNNRLTAFTHGVGFPVNRYQYNVPLSFLPPSEAISKPHAKKDALVGLHDLYPTLLSLAEISVPESDGRSLWDASFPNKDRSLLLTSSIPLRLDPNNPELIATFWKNTLDKDGFHFFPRELEKELEEKRAIALVKLPYRFVYNPQSYDSLYEEQADPHAIFNRVEEKQQIARTLKEELCREYKITPCTLKLPKKKGSLVGEKNLTGDVFHAAH